MHTTIALAGVAPSGPGYFWLSICVSLAVTGFFISQRVIAKIAHSETLARILMVPFINVLMLVLIARYV